VDLMRSIFHAQEENPLWHCAPVRITYLDRSNADECLAHDRVMAAIGFGTRSAIDALDPRRVSVGLPELQAPGTVEVWYSGEPLTAGESRGIFFVKNETGLFANLLLDETNYSDLAATTYEAYRRILGLVQEQGYPHVLRVWNYFPDINVKTSGLERYKAFCVGRYRALKAIPDFERKLPAACAIGTQSPGFLIYFLAAKDPGVQVENPRQISAFRYPKHYAPKSPSFSRAILKRWGNETCLYISGTSSIVGHDTWHRRDTGSQLNETLNNLDALIAHANQFATGMRFSLLRTYIREDEDLAAIKQQIAGRFGEVPMLFLRGDTCRSDLLIEIEGVCIGAAQPFRPMRG